MVAALPRVFVLLLNYRGAADTMACLDSLRALDYPNYRIIVVDNASPDDSARLLQERLNANPGEFHFIQSPENGGFSAGNNLGIQYALEQAGDGAGYVWILNNDTTVAPDALTHLVILAERTGGLVGSLLLYPDGSYQQVATRIRWWTGSTKGYPESALRDGMAVETLSGASMLVPLAAFRKAGLMDPGYFLYFEDGEFSLRCGHFGFPCHVALQAKVYHKEGATTGRKSLPTQYYYYRNRLRMLMAFAHPVQKATILAYAVYRLLRSVVKSLVKPSPERKASARVHWLAFRDFMQGVSGPCPHDLNRL